MNIKNIVLAGVLMGGALSGCQKHADRANLKTYNDSLSYALGYTKGVSIKNSLSREIPSGDSLVDKDIMIAAFINAMKEDKANTQMSVEDARNIIQEYFQDCEARRAVAESDAYQKVKGQNDKYMEDRAKEPGMVALPKPDRYDGPSVLVKATNPGKGDTIGGSDYVYMTLSNKLADGKLIFATPDGEPVLAPVGGLVRGLKQAMRTLRPGAVATVVVPSELGYGRQGNSSVPANSIMIFDVNVVKVFKKEVEARAFWKQEKEKRAAAKAANADNAN